MTTPTHSARDEAREVAVEFLKRNYAYSQNWPKQRLIELLTEALLTARAEGFDDGVEAAAKAAEGAWKFKPFNPDITAYEHCAAAIRALKEQR